MSEVAAAPSEQLAGPVGRALARGSLWVASGHVLSALARLTVSVTAARVLAPADFGLMGLALLVLATLQALSETGVERAFVQRADATGYADVAWTLLLGRSLLLGLLLLAISAPLASFYGQPELAPMLGIMTVALLAGGLRNAGSVLLHRQLAFDKLFAIEAVRALSHLAVGLSLVLVLRSVWALVASHLVTALVEVGISYAIHPHRPRLELNREKTLELLRFGRWITGMSVLALLVTRGDDMFIGKYLGSEALGIYVLAYEIANVPATHITHVLGRVSFPAYARLHAASDRTPLREAFLAVTRSTVLLSGSATVILAFCASALIEHVLGPQWRPAIALVPVLLAAGFVRSLAALGGSLFHAVGRPDLDFKMNLPRLLLLALLIWPACRLAGLQGAALLVLFAVCSCLPTWLRGVREVAGLSLLDLCRHNMLALVVAAVLAAAFALGRLVLPGATPAAALGQLVLALGLALAALIALDRTTRFRVFADVRRLREALRSKRTALAQPLEQENSR
jgi:O-antigen/teichoic acid export membrane protein